MYSSDNDSDSDWNREMFIAVSKKQGKGRIISEQERCKQIQDCLDQGADIDTLNKNGDTVLHVAVKKGYQEVVRFLQQRGANIDVCNQLDCRADTLAADLGKLEIARILRDPFEQQTRKAAHLQSTSSKFPSLVNERVSTSQEVHVLHEQTSASSSALFKRPFRTKTFDEDTKSLKRKPSDDNGIRKNDKKRRSVLNEAFQRDSHHEHEVYIGPREDTLEEEFLLQRKDRETIQTSFSDDGRTYAASGLKRSSHGMIYQLKHLMLILNRIRKMGYPFRLSTEMDAAEKFDDLVLHYLDHSGTEMHRFMQIKHKQDGTKKITANQLLDVKDGEFSVLKYFISWRKIKKHLDFSKSRSKLFVLCTNIGLDVEGLEAADINVSEVEEPDQFLKVINGTEQPPRYKLTVTKRSQLYDTLKKASYVHQLAKVLAQRVHESKEIDLKTDIFKHYHVVLAEEVVDTSRKRFSDNFIRNRDLSVSAENFRKIFFLNMKQLSAEKNESDDDVWKRLENRSLKLSFAFGRKLKRTIESMPNKLPDDLIDDREISEFLNEFVLAVNQPNEVELGEMIKQEIGTDSQFNLLDADFIGDSFQTAMLDWFKEAGKCGRFLKNEDAEEFFSKVEIKLSSLITMGLSLEYPEKLKKFGIKFNHVSTELQKFIHRINSDQNQIWKLISSENTLLTALSVYQTLMQVPKFKKNDSFVFINLKTLLLPKITAKVLRAFKWPRNHDLLVIDCEAISLKKHEQKLWNPLCDIMKKNSNKRAILIIQKNKDSTIQFQISSKSVHDIDDDISIDNLKEYSRQKLLRKMVIKFQGQEEKTSFRRLLGYHNFDDTESEELNNLRRIIDPNTLVQLIKGEEIQIGSKVVGFSDIQNYYIPRTIVQHVIIDEKIFEYPLMTEMFVICGIDREVLEKLLNNKIEVKLFEEISHTEIHGNKFIILDHGWEREQFKILCARNSDSDIHWLQFKSGKWIWKHTFGNITINLMKHKVASQDDDHLGPGATFLKEDQLLDHDHQRRIVILSDKAGMGKSTILTSLSVKLKDSDPNLLVLRINLTHHTTVLAEEKANQTFDIYNTDRAVDFLVDKLLKPDTELESQLYKTIIKDSGGVSLLFDGFDEICPTYEDIVIELLEVLVQLPIKKIFITTRPYTHKVLERHLRTFSLKLQPFSQDDQIEFLKKIWKLGLTKKYDSDETLEEHLKLHAEKVVNLLAKSIDLQMTEFTGVPLQTRMVAEVFQYDRKEDLNPDSEDDSPKLPTKLDIIDLYSWFVDKKYNIFFTEKQSGDNTNLAAIQSRDIGHRIFLKTHQKFSLDALYSGKIVKALLRSQPEVASCIELCRGINEGAERTGIITQVIDGVPHFIHRTFAEYFAAEFLVNTLKEECRNKKLQRFFVTELFVKPQHKTTRAFLNCLLSNNNYGLECELWKLDLREHLPTFCETLYHVAAIERNDAIVRYFLKRLGNQRLYQPQYESFPRPGHRLQLHKQHRTFKKLQWLVKYGRKIVESSSSNLKGGIPLIDYRNADNRTALNIALSTGGNLWLIKCFVEGGASVNSQDDVQIPPLHDAVGNASDLETVKYLIDKGANIHATYGVGWTPLHYAAANKSANLDVLKYLVEKGADIHSKALFHLTPLHHAIDVRANSDIVKYLVEKGANVQAPDKYGRTPLHRAIGFGGYANVVEYLVEKSADVDVEDENGLTPLHLGADSAGNFETVMYLIDKGANIHSRDENGRTPLHHVADIGGALDMVKYLLQKGADLHSRDEEHRTPLHYAADIAGNFDVVKYFVEKGADVNARDKIFASTPLHYAVARAHKMYIVNFLIDKGADIHAEDKHGLTPLHYIAAGKSLNLIAMKYLIAKGADISAKDKRGLTPIDYADRVGNLDVVKRLVFSINQGIDIDLPDEYVCKSVDEAVFTFHNFNVVDYLLKKGADIESQDKNRRTPLHIAAQARDYLLRGLVEDLSDVE